MCLDDRVVKPSLVTPGGDAALTSDPTGQGGRRRLGPGPGAGFPRQGFRSAESRNVIPRDLGG